MSVFGSISGTAIDFLKVTASTSALRSTQPLSQWVPGDHSQGIKRSGPEADYSQTSAEVKNGDAIHPLPHTPFNYLSTGTTSPLPLPLP
jgi:hypothetical protein